MIFQGAFSVNGSLAFVRNECEGGGGMAGALASVVYSGGFLAVYIPPQAQQNCVDHSRHYVQPPYRQAALSVVSCPWVTHKIPTAEVLVGCFFRRPVLLCNVFPAAWRATEASPVIPAIGAIYPAIIGVSD